MFVEWLLKILYLILICGIILIIVLLMAYKFGYSIHSVIDYIKYYIDIKVIEALLTGSFRTMKYNGLFFLE